MRISCSSAAAAAALATALLSSLPATALAKEAEPPKPCTVKSPSTNAFFDLSGISLLPMESGKKSKDDRHRESSWYARGYDYNTNFTLNFCAPVVEELTEVSGLTGSQRRGNVSAYYTKKGRTFSIGSVSTEPIFRGRKLVLNYTGGSPCQESGSRRRDTMLPRMIQEDEEEDEEDDDTEEKGKTGSSKKSKAEEDKKEDAKKSKGHDDEDDEGGDDEDDDDDGGSRSDKRRRKSTIISFLCQRDPTASKVAVSFVGTVDECTYFFEARTPLACEGASTNTSEVGGVGPAGVFGLIVLIAVAAYIIGGVAYQRTVMHQRGWKQLPNYGLWASMWNFIKDFVVIIFSSCSRLIPSRRGYNQLPTYTDRSRFSRNEDENRLIDQLDEEWDD